MSRLFAIALSVLGLTSSALAQPTVGQAVDPAETTPEKLLSSTSQLYVRWDGITAHNEAYKKSVWGAVMAGPTGSSIKSLLAQAPKLLGSNLLANPLLEGKPPEELKATLGDLKNVGKIIDLIADKGVIVAAEVREPTPTLRGVGEALGGLLGGKAPDLESITPDVQLLIVVPDVADRAEVLFAAIRMLIKKSDGKIEPFSVAGRKGFQTEVPPENASRLFSAWWVEGKHFIFYAGTTKIETAVSEVVANARKGGITAHPLFQRCRKNPGYESITRGFVDAARVVTLARSLAGPLIPGLNQRIDDLGLGNLKAIVFNSGFDGKESRATYDFDLPGERKGLAKVLKQQAIGLGDLPPLPPDVSRFSALRVDAAATYDAGIMVLETLLINESFGPEDDAKSPAEKIRLRREYLMKEADKLFGVHVQKDLLPHLGDKIVMFQSPTEGLSILGNVVCVSLKDPAKFKLAADRIQRGLETLLSSPIKIRKKMLCGVEIRELYSPGFFILTPTYAIVGDWLVISLHPQPVQGFVLRTKGEIPTWKPDAATAARLAKLPADACGLQYCDPRSTVQNLCCIGPLALNLVGSVINRAPEGETDYDPIDVGLIPNAHELSKHLFPNLTVTRDDGKTVRIEVNESFSLPLEFIGLEVFVVGASFLGALGGF